MTVVELIVASAVALIVLGGLSTIFVSGLRTGSATDARLTAQEAVRRATDRLEYEVRCAQGATILSAGAGVALTLPTWCTHTTSTAVAWCVSGGSLVRYDGATACGTGTALTYVDDISSATPFSCVAPVGALPQLSVTLAATVPGHQRAATDAASLTDVITLRNADYTTAGTSSCV